MPDLEQLNNQYEEMLKVLGINLIDLVASDELKDTFQLYNTIKLKTGLCALDKTYLMEYYFTKRKEFIDKQLIANNLKNDIEHLQNEICQEENEIREYLGFKTNIGKTNKSTEKLESSFKVIRQLQKNLDEQKASLGDRKIDYNFKGFLRKMNFD